MNLNIQCAAMAQASVLFRGSTHAALLAALHISASPGGNAIKVSPSETDKTSSHFSDVIYVSSDDSDDHGDIVIIPSEKLGEDTAMLPDDIRSTIQPKSPAGKKANDDDLMIANALRKKMEEDDAQIARELQSEFDAECAQDLQEEEDAKAAFQLDSSLNGATETKKKQTNPAATAAADAAEKRAQASASRGKKTGQCVSSPKGRELDTAAAAADVSTQPQPPEQQFTRPIHNERVACHFNSAVQFLVSIPALHQSIEAMIFYRTQAQKWSDEQLRDMLRCTKDTNLQMLNYLKQLKKLFGELLSVKGRSSSATVNVEKTRTALWNLQKLIGKARSRPEQYFGRQQAADETIDLLVYQHGLIAPMETKQIEYEANGKIKPLAEYGHIGQTSQWFYMQARPSLKREETRTLLEAIKAALIDDQTIRSRYTAAPDYAIVHVDRAISFTDGEGKQVDSKILAAVTVGEQIDLQSVIKDSTDAITYVPVAMIVHIGETMTSGHYIALTRRKHETNVTIYNDGSKYTANEKTGKPFATFMDALRQHSSLKKGSVTHVLLYREDKWAAIRSQLG